MPNSLDYNQFSAHLSQAQTILIILGANASFDQQLAASSLYLSLKPQNKKVSLLAPQEIKNPTISGLDQLKTAMGHKNLVISFDYVETAVHNVSYHIDEDSKKFYLTIKPQSGESPLDKDLVKTEYAGAEADLLVVFGVEDLEQLDQLYIGYEDLYQNVTILAISKFKPTYQCTHVNSSLISSDCEVVYQLLKSMGASFGSEIATNLLAGIQYETNNFIDPKASADTFEAVSWLIRSGAQRKAGSFSLQKDETSISLSKESGKKTEIALKQQKIVEKDKEKREQVPSLADRVQVDHTENKIDSQKIKPKVSSKLEEDKKSDKPNAKAFRPSGLRR